MFCHSFLNVADNRLVFCHSKVSVVSLLVIGSFITLDAPLNNTFSVTYVVLILWFHT